jgi:hypothetical protein
MKKKSSESDTAVPCVAAWWRKRRDGDVVDNVTAVVATIKSVEVKAAQETRR